MGVKSTVTSKSTLSTVTAAQLNRTQATDSSEQKTFPRHLVQLVQKVITWVQSWFNDGYMFTKQVSRTGVESQSQGSSIEERLSMIEDCLAKHEWEKASVSSEHLEQELDMQASRMDSEARARALRTLVRVNIEDAKRQPQELRKELLDKAAALLRKASNG